MVDAHNAPDIRGPKADEGTWDRILDRLGIDPTTILFIDDSPEKIVKAKTYGICHTIQFQDAEQLLDELEPYAII